jgi:hypothetical protein
MFLTPSRFEKVKAIHKGVPGKLQAGEYVWAWSMVSHIPRDNRKPGLPCPRMNVFDMSDLPQYPWANHDCPEQLYKDRWNPASQSAEFCISVESVLPFESSTAAVVIRALAKEAPVCVEAA